MPVEASTNLNVSGLEKKGKRKKRKHKNGKTRREFRLQCWCRCSKYPLDVCVCVRVCVRVCVGWEVLKTKTRKQKGKATRELNWGPEKRETENLQEKRGKQKKNKKKKKENNTATRQLHWLSERGDSDVIVSVSASVSSLSYCLCCAWNHRSLLQNLVSLIGLFCKRDLWLEGAY